MPIPKPEKKEDQKKFMRRCVSEMIKEYDREAYDLFKFKGGVNCGHVWEEVLYRLKDATKKSDKLKDYNEVDSIPKSYKAKPAGSEQSKVAPLCPKDLFTPSLLALSISSNL